MDQAEAMFVSLGPLEVVDERPLEIAAHVHPSAYRLLQVEKMPLKVIYSPSVVDAAVQVYPIAIGHAILGDDDRKFIPVGHKSWSPMQDLGSDLPEAKRMRIAGRKLGLDRFA